MYGKLSAGAWLRKACEDLDARDQFKEKAADLWNEELDFLLSQLPLIKKPGGLPAY